MKFRFEKEVKFTLYPKRNYWPDNTEVLIKKLRLIKPKKWSYEHGLIEAFCNTNIRNIDYYRKKIFWETFWRKVYQILTYVLTIGIPILIIAQTENIADHLKGLDSLGSAGKTGGFLTAAIGSIIGFHKLVTLSIEKRRVRGIFHKAKADLMNILFEIIDDAAYRAQDVYDDHDEEREFSDEIIQALYLGVQKSRTIVNDETQKYFELVDSLSYDISSVLTGAANTARSLFSSYKSKKFEFEMNYLLEEEKERRSKEKAMKEATETNEINLSILSRKLKKLTERENTILENIEVLEQGEVTEQSQLKLEKYQDQLEKCEQELDEIEDQYEELDVKIEHAIEKYDFIN